MTESKSELEGTPWKPGCGRGGASQSGGPEPLCVVRLI